MDSLAKEIMITANRLIALMEFCSDDELIDEVCMNVRSAVPFDEELIDGDIQEEDW